MPGTEGQAFQAGNRLDKDTLRRKADQFQEQKEASA